MKKKPNVIYFFCDDLGWGDVTFLNAESRIHTPHIDALASAGVFFSDSHTPSGVCTPSRYALLTGRYCWRTPQLKWHVNGGYSPGLIRDGRRTLPHELKKAGYQSACIGKWHVGMDWKIKGGRPPQQDLMADDHLELGRRIDHTQPVTNGPNAAGFDYFYGTAASLDMPPYSWIENDALVTQPTEILPWGEGELRAASGFAMPGWKHENVLPTMIEKACAYIAQNGTSEKPFFLYIPITAPHTPVVPTREWVGKSECGAYGDFVMQIDHSLGQIAHALEEAGIRDDSLLCFSSDNGPETITADYREKYNHFSAWNFKGLKRDNWEGGHRTPFIMSWPGTLPAGHRVDHYIEQADFTATIADICGLPTHDDDFCEDSFSLMPLIKNNPSAYGRECALHHSWEGKWAIRRNQWKLLLHPGSGGNPTDDPRNNDPVQLYNMEEDPYETRNLYKDYASVVDELKTLCKDIILQGRSTPGKHYPVDQREQQEWAQLQDILAL